MLSGKTVVITGGNSGIGRATAVALLRMGARVIFTARDPERGERARAAMQADGAGDRVRCMHLDLASLRSVGEFADALLTSESRIDVLVNNAGLILGRRHLTEDGHESTFAVNHLGHFALTLRLLDRLRQSAPSRIVNVASHAHRKAWNGLDFDDLHSARSYRPFLVYARSKLCNVLFTRELARRLAGTGVTCNALHPGVVRTGFARDGDVDGWLAVGVRLASRFFIDEVRGAATTVHLASSPDVAQVSGAYFARCRPARPSRAARDDAAAARLWAVSEALIG
jgi:NAD(P)-dependent dehydrogenase (short-subunit alcohol dehydrogenase family)